MTPERMCDLSAGILMGALGVCAAGIGMTYDVGTLTAMGPGFFPVVIGILLIAVSLGLVASAFKAQEPGAEGGYTFAWPDWRGGICIMGGVAAFLVLGKYFGLAPAAMGCVTVAAAGDRSSTLPKSLILAAGITVSGVLLFAYGLKVQMPVLMWPGW